MFKTAMVFFSVLFLAVPLSAQEPGNYYVRVVLCAGKGYCLEHHLRTDTEVNHVRCIMSAWQAAVIFQQQQFPTWKLKECECVERIRIKT